MTTNSMVEIGGKQYPSDVHIGACTYQILWTEQAWEERRVEQEWSSDPNDQPLATTNHPTNRIWVRPGQGRGEIINSLFHEIFHCVFHQMPDLFNVKNEHHLEEYIVTSQTPWWLTVLKDNATLFEWIQDPGMQYPGKPIPEPFSDEPGSEERFHRPLQSPFEPIHLKPGDLVRVVDGEGNAREYVVTHYGQMQTPGHLAFTNQPNRRIADRPQA